MCKWVTSLQHQHIQIRVEGYNISQESSAILTKTTEPENQFLEKVTVNKQKFQKLCCILTVADDE
jgi:hypothetical protein